MQIFEACSRFMYTYIHEIYRSVRNFIKIRFKAASDTVLSFNKDRRRSSVILSTFNEFSSSLF